MTCVLEMQGRVRHCIVNVQVSLILNRYIRICELLIEIPRGDSNQTNPDLDSIEIQVLLCVIADVPG